MLKIKMKKKISRKALYGIIAFLGTALIIFCILNINLLNRMRQIETYSNSLSEFYINREKELNQKEEDLVNKIKDLNEKYFEKRLYEVLEEDDLLFLAKKQWKYELFLNGNVFDISGKDVYIKENEVVITLKETCNKELLPEKILNYGSISMGNPSNNLKDNLIIRSDYVPEITEEKIGNGIVIHYKFVGLHKVSIAVIQLSELLRERLNSSNKVLNIIYE